MVEQIVSELFSTSENPASRIGNGPDAREIAK
jgi:hypothetical protein